MDIGEQTFFFISTPLFIFNIAAKIFFACCLIFPFSSRQQLKGPLKTLLGTIVFCTLFCLFLAFFLFIFKDHIDLLVDLVLLFSMQFFGQSSISCHIWLNLYYHTQIVPAHRELSIWVKKNIKSVIYVLLIFDGIIFSVSCSLEAASTFKWDKGANGTLATWYTTELDYARFVCYLITQGHTFNCFAIMVVCNFSITHYLRKHVKNMARKGSSETSPRLQSQIRVAITGIFQGILSLSLYTFYIFVSLVPNVTFHYFFSIRAYFFGILLYMTGSTVNLGIGQAVFRKNAAKVWKATKAKLGTGTITHDVQKHTASMTK